MEPPGPASFDGDAAPGLPTATAIPTAAPDTGRHGWLTSAILDIERTWLGMTTPPLWLRIEEVGWQPDEPGAYCWRCGTTVGAHDADSAGCSTCRGKRTPWERIVRLGSFDGLLREVIHDVKFSAWRRLGEDVGRLLGQVLLRQLEGARIDLDRTVLVPVPTSFRRRMARGIDHPLVIARGVTRETGLPIVRALERDHRPTQQSLPAAKRAANLAGAIRMKRWVDLSGKVAVLVDDVTTTRATLVAACRALRGSRARTDPVARRNDGVRLWTAVLGVTPTPESRR